MKVMDRCSLAWRQALRVHCLTLHLLCALIPFLAEGVFSQFSALAGCCRASPSITVSHWNHKPNISSSFYELLVPVASYHCSRKVTNAQNTLPSFSSHSSLPTLVNCKSSFLSWKLVKKGHCSFTQ